MEVKASRAWVDEILEYIDTLDPSMMSPNHPLCQTDKKIVVIEDEWLRKVFVCYLMNRREADTLKTDMKYASPEEVNDIDLRYQHAQRRVDFVHMLFWASTRNYYNIHMIPSIGLRANWTLVEDLRSNDLPPILRMMGFGGGDE